MPNPFIPVLVVVGVTTTLVAVHKSIVAHQKLRKLSQALYTKEQDLEALIAHLNDLDTPVEEWIRLMEGVGQDQIVFMNTQPVAMGDYKEANRILTDALMKNEYIAHETYVHARTNSTGVHPQSLEEDETYFKLLADVHSVWFSTPHVAAQDLVQHRMERGLLLPLHIAVRARYSNGIY